MPPAEGSREKVSPPRNRAMNRARAESLRIGLVLSINRLGGGIAMGSPNLVIYLIEGEGLVEQFPSKDRYKDKAFGAT
jgi:hypothetical protein